MSDSQKEIDLTRLRDACRALGEHFETVHIFTTRDEPSAAGTVSCNFGTGNWYARYGSVREWMLRVERDDTAEML